MKTPAGASFSNFAPMRAGKRPTSTRPPSNGGIGSILNKARTALTVMPAWAINTTQLSNVWPRRICRTAASTTHQNSAIKTFAAGPASATRIIARRGLRSTLVSTGTGFAQPNNGNPSASNDPGIRTVPIGSIWRSGFKLKRPSNSAVRSPKYRAVQPCATSCRVMANRTGMA
jgi:hypothetical protein